MDKRILEGVKEFYQNVKDQEFSWDMIPNPDYSTYEQKRKNNIY